MRETGNQPTITLSNRGGGNKFLLINELRFILLFSMLFLTSLFILYSATKLHTFPHIRKKLHHKFAVVNDSSKVSTCSGKRLSTTSGKRTKTVNQNQEKTLKSVISVKCHECH